MVTETELYIVGIFLLYNLYIETKLFILRRKHRKAQRKFDDITRGHKYTPRELYNIRELLKHPDYSTPEALDCIQISRKIEETQKYTFKGLIGSMIRFLSSLSPKESVTLIGIIVTLIIGLVKYGKL